MVLENQVIPFIEWIKDAAIVCLLTFAVLAVIGVVIGLLVAVVRHGPVAGFRIAGRVLASAFFDLFCMSPRRVWALARLAIRDSLRRRIVVVFILFVLFLLFAGWFLDPSSDHPLQLYINFVLTTTTYLVLLLMLFLSAFSLPGDLKNKTLHTIVTKPVRSSEIVLGRILGFTVLGTLLLALMGVISYGFVSRGLAHVHKVDVTTLVATDPDAATDGQSPMRGKSTITNGHQHDVALNRQGNGRLEITQDHFHHVLKKTKDGKTVYEVGPPEGMQVARVPVYGKLRFVNSQRQAAPKGINVGDEWSYRSYIEGGTLAAGVWVFDNVTPKNFNDKLQLEMTLGVFRTWKGDIEQGIAGVLLLRNPKTGLTVETKVFKAREFSTDVHHLARKLTPMNAYYLKGTADSDGILRYVRKELKDNEVKPQYDLFDDLTDNGNVEIWLQCLDPNQYFGVAQADLYLRAKDASYILNFAKGYFGVWMQMVLVICFGVMFSTFLNGSVAMIATIGMLVGGFFRGFMIELALGKTWGGGPFESIIRIFTQDNVVSDLPDNFRTLVAKTLDSAMQPCFGALARILPPFQDFYCADYVAHGFNIPEAWLAEQGLTTLSFAVGLFVVGYFFLKTREVAR